MQEFSIFQTYVIYGIVILLTVFFAKTSVKSNYKIVRKLSVFLTILIPSIVAGLRYYVGTDYETYYNLYIIINSGEKTRIEYGFELLNKALYLIGLNEQSIFFASSLIIMFFIYKALYRYRETLDIGLGMGIFMLLYYFSSFNVIRLMIAVSICFYNVENIKEKNFLKFLIYNLIAISFHNTAITQLPMYFVYNYIVSKKNIITQLCVYCLIIICMINFNETFEFILSFIGKEKGVYYSSYIGISQNSIVTVF
ncbi:MAG: EpsG family protein, partial [Terrisporobacter sp.]